VRGEENLGSAVDVRTEAAAAVLPALVKFKEFLKK
jgi:hypothetical protein